MTDEWPYDDKMFAALHATASAGHASDAEMVDHLASHAGGPEAVERARARAAELIDAAHASGELALLAGRLSRSSFLSGDDVARILNPQEHHDV